MIRGLDLNSRTIQNLKIAHVFNGINTDRGKFLEENYI